MRVAVPFAVVTGSILLFGAGGAGGDEPAKHTLASALRWKVGDAVRRTETLDFESKNHYWATGGSAGDDNFVFHSEAAWVERCTEADAEGQPTRVEVTLETWSWLQSKDKQPDTTLAGRKLVVTGLGDKRKAALDGAPAKAPGPTIWIAVHFGATEGPPGTGRLLPKEPVAVGATWSGDFAGFANAALDFAPVADKVTGEAKLVSVDEKGRPQVAWKISAPTQGYSKPLIPWTSGGTASVEGEFTLVPGAVLPDGSEHWTALVEGEASDGKVNYRLRKRIEVRRTYAPAAAVDGSAPKDAPK